MNMREASRLVDKEARLFQNRIEQTRAARGDTPAAALCAAHLSAVSQFLEMLYGPRGAYEVFQGIADQIIEKELPK